MCPFTFFSTHAIEDLRIFDDLLANRTDLVRGRTGMRDNSTTLNVWGQCDLNTVISRTSMWRPCSRTTATTVQSGLWVWRVSVHKILEISWYFIESDSLCWRLPNQFLSTSTWKPLLGSRQGSLGICMSRELFLTRVFFDFQFINKVTLYLSTYLIDIVNQ